MSAGFGLLSRGLGVRGKMRRPPKNPIPDPQTLLVSKGLNIRRTGGSPTIEIRLILHDNELIWLSAYSH